MLFPVMCWMLRKERWIMLCMLGLIIIGPFNRVALAGRDPWGDYAYLSCMDGIAFGCITAWITARVRPGLTVSKVAMILGAVIVVTIVVLRKQTAELGLTKAGLNVTALESGVALLLIGFARGVGNTALSQRNCLAATGGTMQLRDLSHPHVCGTRAHASFQEPVWIPASHCRGLPGHVRHDARAEYSLWIRRGALALRSSQQDATRGFGAAPNSPDRRSLTRVLGRPGVQRESLHGPTLRS